MKNVNEKSGKNVNGLPKTAAIVYSDVKRKYFPTEEQYITEKDALRDAEFVGQYLTKLGVVPKLYAGDVNLTKYLQRDKPAFAINMVGSVRGQEYLSATIPAVLELLEIPYTGADMLGESLGYNKFLIKKLLQHNGIPVPDYQLVNSYKDPIYGLRFPLISKLNEIHGSVEINQNAVSENEKQLRERLRYLIKTYDQSVLVEEYIGGREVTAFLLEGQNKKVYMAEVVYKKTDEKYTLTTFESQWVDVGWSSYHYKKYLDNKLKEYVKKAFEITKMYDYGKFDVRIDESGRYYFIDSNSNPYIGPKEIDSQMAYILELHGVPFTDILRRLILNTMRRWAGKKLLPYPASDQ